MAHQGDFLFLSFFLFFGRGCRESAGKSNQPCTVFWELPGVVGPSWGAQIIVVGPIQVAQIFRLGVGRSCPSIELSEDFLFGLGRSWWEDTLTKKFLIVSFFS